MLKRTAFLRKPTTEARLSVPVKRKCKVCRETFALVRPMQAVCGPECAHKAIIQTKIKLDISAGKEERKGIRARKEAIKNRGELTVEAQKEFNLYVRLRDIKAGHGCIDCGKPFEAQRPGGSIDAGHFLSRGSNPQLKFDERNVFAQRKNCNRPGGATAADFRAGVVARIGPAAVEALEADQAPKHYSLDDLRAIRDKYRAAARQLQKETT
jgi:hypothetical protein